MILLFDLGATHVRYCLASDDRMGEVVRCDTDPDRGGFDEWLDDMGVLVGDHRLRAVIGGMAGELEGIDGQLRHAPNLPDWLGLPVTERLHEQFGCPVFIKNDAVMGGLGEAYDGAGTRRGVMVYFTISTGVNAVRLVDGHVDQTITRFEVGQQLLEENDPAIMTLESVVGGAATERRFGRPPAQIHDSRLWHQDERVVARVAYNTALYWTPDVIVFGGSMMRDIAVPAVEREMMRLPQALPNRPRLAKARLGDLAGLHGALRWWAQHKK